MIEKIGDLINRVTTAVKQFGVSPYSSIVVRVGDFGPELEIDELKVQGGLDGPKLVLQVKAPG